MALAKHSTVRPHAGAERALRPASRHRQAQRPELGEGASRPHQLKVRLSRAVRIIIGLSSLSLFPFAPPARGQATDYLPADTVLTDAQFFAALDLNHPGLEGVKAAQQRNDLTAARQHLCAYYRARGPGFWWKRSEPKPTPRDGEQAMRIFASVQARTGDFAEEYWRPNPTEFDWSKPDDQFQRMYFFSALGHAYRHSGDERMVRAWVDLYRAWIRQYPGPKSITMPAGIRLRSGWSEAFVSFARSPSWDDESMFVFLKSYYEQALHLRNHHSETSNWLTFEMAGLFSAGVLFPEFKAAAEWRQHAMQTAFDDLDRGWLPDGVTIELSPGYGAFFSNYLLLVDLARETGHASPLLDGIVRKTERLYEPYLQLMTPDGRTPEFQDNQAVDVPKLLGGALARFPQREDFQWAATRGQHGSQPAYLSVAFPYAGYLIVRSGWHAEANYLAFDAGPVGYRHAHQDKLSLVFQAYGRQILYDPGRRSNEDALSSYCLDTFSHSTGLVDNRPQRRKWYQYPTPSRLPYQPLADFRCELAADRVWASGAFSDHYGRAGEKGNDGYPYKKGSNFAGGWSKPASHLRQIAYAAPDIFVVQDWFVPNDDQAHTYEIRWQIDSVQVQTDARLRTVTADAAKPNLALIALQTEGLEACTVHAGEDSGLMGWKVLEKPHPATTLRHLKSGQGSRGFLTVLFPLRTGASADEVVCREEKGRITLRTAEGREWEIRPAAGPQDRLTIQIGAAKTS